MALPLPTTMAVVLTLKVHEPFGNSKTGYGTPHTMELVLSDGYLGFRARVRRRVDKLKEIEWQEAGPILLKPTISASQAKQAAFKLELFIYVSKVAAFTTIRQATEGRIAAAASLIDEHLSALPAAEQLGEVSQAYWAVTHARQLEQTALVMLTNSTFTQLQRIDTLQREADSATQAISNSREFITIQFRISGVVVPLEVNASDMREGFDLPDYDLRPPYD
ncbi:hypothetical protein GN958_ATG09362 [Phytophthora infestans]|uniref:Uncharacterized protein n=1 Tax=Phytophthora infestans TaxID=4787 RepID=A0A8S9UKU1_PHYIN|nr:hypothetical protein GN958_ATG09362 [Phytophthora infestans]